MRRAAIVILLIFAATVAAGSLWYEWENPYRGYRGKAAVLDLERGMTTREIARKLQSAGVVRSALAFELWSRIHYREKLEAGEYRFDRPMTAPEVFDTVAQGRIWSVTLTVPEGWTMFDIADAVDREGLASRAAFLRAARNPAPIRDLASSVPTLEGFLFPATYQFPHRTTARAIVDQMVARFRQAWADLTRNDPLPASLTPAQIVTLASLVDEETPKLAEKPVIAGVFLNRLRLGYPLECDPSVIYALKLAGLYTGQLHAADMNFPSPYNTYLNYGLPPGPIGNPGLASLQSVLAPAHTGYLYFVADGSGGHVFSRTLAQHRLQVAQYRRFIDSAKAGQQQTAPRDVSPIFSGGGRLGNELHP